MKRETRLFSAISFLLLGACGTDPNTGADTAAQNSASTRSAEVSSETSEAEDVGAGSVAANGAEVAADADAHGASGETASALNSGGGDTWQGMRMGTNFWFLSAGWAEAAWKEG